MTTTATPTTEYLDACPRGRIRVDPINPRTHIAVDDDFVASIASGILEPLIVRVDPAKTQLVDDQGPVDFLLIAGHRRLLAAERAELDAVPVVVRHDLADDKAALVAMIVENGQRENLPPLDEARGIEQLVGMGMSQREAAKAIGREQGTISKRLSLLKLPQRAQQLLDEERITVKTALGLTGLVKHNDRMSNVLDWATQDPNANDADIAEHVHMHLAQLQREKQAAAEAKAHEKAVAQAIADGYTQIDEDDDNYSSYEECDADDADITAFEVAGTNIYYLKPAREADDEPGGNGSQAENNTASPDTVRSAERERRAEAQAVRRSLIENLVRDGYPGDEDALLHTARLFAVDFTQIAMVTDLFTLVLPDLELADDENQNEVAVIEAINENTARAAFAAALLAGDNSYEGPVRRQHVAFLMHHGYQPTSEERALFGDTVPDGNDEETVEEELPSTVVAEPTPDIATVDTEPEKLEEPWRSYNAFGITRTIKIINSTDPPRTPDQLEACIAYERANGNRRQIIAAAEAKLEQLTSVGT